MNAVWMQVDGQQNALSNSCSRSCRATCGSSANPHDITMRSLVIPDTIRKEVFNDAVIGFVKNAGRGA